MSDTPRASSEPAGKVRDVIGLLVGDRRYFSPEFARDARRRVSEAIAAEGAQVVLLPPNEADAGRMDDVASARRAAAAMSDRRADLTGIVVTLPNFAEERAIANALRWGECRVPVLIHAIPDALGAMDAAGRRDTFWGKISVCHNLRQYGLPYTLTSSHVQDPGGESFRADLRAFLATCRVVAGLRRLRIGQIGARPAVFNTTRYSEKLFEKSGISVETIDLTDVFGPAEALADDDPAVLEAVGQIRGYLPRLETSNVETPDAGLLRMAKLQVVIRNWMLEHDLSATAIQCWTSMQQWFGIYPCTVMSRMSNALLPSACEADVAGVVSMAAVAYAANAPAALVDWNNNYGDDPDKAVIYHCSNLPKDVFGDPDLVPLRLTYRDQKRRGTGELHAYYGTIGGRIRGGPLTYCRVSTDDVNGRVHAYVGEGELTDDPLTTFGGFGVVKIPRFQALMRHVCRQGFEHHAAVGVCHVASAVEEAFVRYLGWQTYRHDAAGGGDTSGGETS